MTSIDAVLRRNGIAVPESAVAEQLDALLQSSRPRGGVDLSAADEQFLQTYSGVEPIAAERLRELEAASVARLAAEAGRSLSRAEVAAYLGVDASRVSHQVAQGKLFAYAVGHRPAFPDWQFRGSGAGGRGVLPHLAVVVDALPEGAHPLSVRSFMTRPDDDLVIRGTPVSPREWLLSGGDPGVVAALAGTLGEQV